MPRYEVSIMEQTTIYRTEYIEAANEDEAHQKADDKWGYSDGGRSDEDTTIEITDIRLEEN